MWTYVVSMICWLKKGIRRLALPQTITNNRILRLPIISYDGPIILVETLQDAISCVEELKEESVIGFDTETKPCFRKGEFHEPSVVQLAGKDKVYIFQLTKIGGLTALLPLFCDGDILKVGVGVEHDLNGLRTIGKFSAVGFFDLSELSHKLGVKNTGLRTLSGIFLKRRLSKNMQLSDWSQPILSDKQKIYAATDAWISRILYFRMSELI